MGLIRVDPVVQARTIVYECLKSENLRAALLDEALPAPLCGNGAPPEAARGGDASPAVPSAAKGLAEMSDAREAKTYVTLSLLIFVGAVAIAITRFVAGL
jgi:hypothetical protein